MKNARNPNNTSGYARRAMQSRMALRAAISMVKSGNAKTVYDAIRSLRRVTRK